MDQIDQKSDIVKELCAIRRPVVWHRDDTGSNDGPDISVDNQSPANNSDNWQSQQLRSGLNVLD